MNKERGAFPILEEATDLLRAAPASSLVAYLAGAIPFLVALLFFVNEMLRSPFAFDRLTVASLALAVLYIAKNVWQAFFAASLYRTLSPGAGKRASPWRVAFYVAALQPVSLLIPLPFPWTVAFFRNASLFAALGDPEPLRSAARQSTLWTRQNWVILLVMTVAGLLVFLNTLALIVFLPQLGRSFLGIEGDLARAGAHLLNWSTVASAAALAWLVIDPVLDAVYVLRCFYGESLATGEDLLASLRRAVALVVMLLAFVSVTRAQANSIDPVKLDKSIDEVVHRREFAWRAPVKTGPEPQGRIAGWIRGAGDLARRAWNYIVKLIEEWLIPDQKREAPGGAAPAMKRTLETLIALLVALIVAAAIAFYLRRRNPVVAAKPVAAAAPAVNLADDSLTADQLPESSWLRLADEWIAKGDLRLAMRALHLAGLNYLGQRGMISIRKWKSGLDYRRELERRARAQPEIHALFAANTAQFEQIWYGLHPADRAMLAGFADGLARMRSSLESAR